jgi:hypothetical protein
MSEINAAYQVLGEPASRLRYDRQRSNVASGMEATAEHRAPVRRMGVGRVRPIHILFVTALLILACGVDKKPWWQWTWEFLSSGLDSPSHYLVNWPVALMMLGTGVILAWRSGRRAT